MIQWNGNGYGVMTVSQRVPNHPGFIWHELAWFLDQLCTLTGHADACALLNTRRYGLVGRLWAGFVDITFDRGSTWRWEHADYDGTKHNA